jgi:hypothetical protein
MQSISNYNKNRLKLSDTLREFENQIQSLVSDLDKYKQKENPSEKYIFYKQQQINSLKNTLEVFIEFQESSTAQMINYTKEISKLSTTVFKLEGICLYHGICNFSYYLRMRKDALIFTIKEAFNNGYRQTPFELLPEATLEDKKNSQISHLISKAKQLKEHGK